MSIVEAVPGCYAVTPHGEMVVVDPGRESVAKALETCSVQIVNLPGSGRKMAKRADGRGTKNPLASAWLGEPVRGTVVLLPLADEPRQVMVPATLLAHLLALFREAKALCRQMDEKGEADLQRLAMAVDIVEVAARAAAK